MANNSSSASIPAPRLCHLVKWPDFDGYGFNLHAEKNKPGQFIGKVDDGSPAEAAGLRSGDRIVEVNNVNIANENHKQVVERIKAVPGETKLLVVDDVADRYYKERKIVVKHSQENVVVIKAPLTKPGKEEEEVEEEKKVEVVVNGSLIEKEEKPAKPSTEGPPPRLCHLIRWPDYEGYGFDMQADEEKRGQFIEKVDKDSPAEAAGLRSGDRIVEVNDVNIENETHKQVVDRIKAVPGETKLLVVDEAADKYYKEKNIVVAHTHEKVVRIKAPANKPGKESENGPVVDDGSLVQETEKEAAFPMASTPKDDIVKEEKKEEKVEEKHQEDVKVSTPEPQQPSPKQKKEDLNATTPTSSPGPSPTPKTVPSPKTTPSHESASNKSSTASNGSNANSPRPTSLNGSATTASPTLSNNQDKLNLNMTAQEMRALLASRSKDRFDPRKEAMDLRKKHAIVQSM